MLRTIGSVCVAAGLALGCSHENVRAEQQQERNELAQEQSQERQEIARDQNEVNRERAQLQQEQHRERIELNQEQGEEHAEEHAEAREDLVEKTNEIGGDREELSTEVRDLNALVMQACQPVAVADQTACPLDAERVASVNNIGDGVRIKLTPVAGSRAAVEERLACYRARVEVKHSMMRLRAGKTPGPMPAPATAACILDQPGVDMEVSENEGRVQLELTCDGDAAVRTLRTQARILAEGDVSQRSTARADTPATR